MLKGRSGRPRFSDRALMRWVAHWFHEVMTLWRHTIKSEAAAGAIAQGKAVLLYFPSHKRPDTLLVALFIRGERTHDPLSELSRYSRNLGLSWLAQRGMRAPRVGQQYPDDEGLRAEQVTSKGAEHFISCYHQAYRAAYEFSPTQICVYVWLRRPDAEARTLCRAYDIMRADRASSSAGEVARKMVPYQGIRAHRPDTPWFGIRRLRCPLFTQSKRVYTLRMWRAAWLSTAVLLASKSGAGPEDSPQLAILSRDRVRLQLGSNTGTPGSAQHSGCTLWIDVDEISDFYFRVREKVGVEWGPAVYFYGHREFAFRRSRRPLDHPLRSYP